MSVIAVATRTMERPSKVLGIEDSYTAFCFDEACAFVQQKIEAGEEPKFKKEYKSFSELYSSFGL